MLKIGIITFHKAKNYGAVLQTLALQKYIDSIGGESEIIDYNSQLYNHYRIENNGNIVKRLIKSYVNCYQKKKYKRFDKFLRKNIVTSKQETSFNDLSDFVMRNGYTDIITGSDQVWNPKIIGNDYGYLLNIDCKNVKKHSYAASIGLEELDSYFSETLKTSLLNFDKISVREKAAQKLLYDLNIEKNEIVCDPTLLLNEGEWEKYEKKIHVPEKYVLVFAFGQSAELLSSSMKYANSIGAKLCIITDSIIPTNKAFLLRGLGPAEWIYAIHKSACVFTNSYHGLLFSLIFHKEFWVDDPRDGTNSRIKEILELIGEEGRVLANCSSDININYLNVNDKMQYFRERSKDYLKSIVTREKFNYSKRFLAETKLIVNHIGYSDYCTGCTACNTVCPQNAISMRENSKGQLYPIVEEEKCVNCGKCIKVCTINNEYNKKPKFKQQYFVFKNKNSDEVRKTSSGGLFILIARSIIEQGGVVYGVVFDKNNEVVYDKATNEEELWRLCGTKYVESKKDSIFKSVINDLREGKKVLFSGTPCTIFGLKKSTENINNGLLYTIDIICHGVPSPIIYKEYLRYQEKKYHSKIKNIDFRSKLYDSKQNKYTHIQRIRIDFNNGKHYYGPNGKDYYYSLFWQNVLLRESCYSCKYASISRVGDITIGDYWGNKNNKNFNFENTESTLIINTEKGQQLFDEIHNLGYYLEVTKDDIMQRNLYMPTPKNSKENLFWYDYYLHSFDYLLFRYCDKTGIIRILNKIKGKS